MYEPTEGLSLRILYMNRIIIFLKATRKGWKCNTIVIKLTILLTAANFVVQIITAQTITTSLDALHTN